MAGVRHRALGVRRADVRGLQLRERRRSEEPREGARGAPAQRAPEDGLPADWVQSILKDSRGFVWLGTQDGVVRYAGGALTVYRHDSANPRSLPVTL